MRHRLLILAALILSTAALLAVFITIRSGDISKIEASNEATAEKVGEIAATAEQAAEAAESAVQTAEAIATAAGLDWIDVTVERPDGTTEHVVVGRAPGESDKDFVDRVGRIVRGEEGAGGNCLTLQCPTGEVKVCVTCMVGEPQEDCDARRDALATAWCEQNPGCTGCP